MGWWVGLVRFCKCAVCVSAEKQKNERWAKIKSLRVWSCLAQSVTLFRSLSLVRLYVAVSVTIAYNVSGLCVRAGFGAQNCQPALNLNRSTKLQVCTSPRLTQNPCWRLVFISLYYKSLFIFLNTFSKLSIVCLSKSFAVSAFCVSKFAGR